MSRSGIFYQIELHDKASRPLAVAGLRTMMSEVKDSTLALLVRSLPVNVVAGAHEFCELLGVKRPWRQLLIKHNISVAYELKRLLDDRVSDRATTNGEVTPGEATHGSNKEAGDEK